MKKFVSLTLALVMALSLVACGQQTTQQPSNSGNSGSQQAGQDQSTNPTVEPRTLRLAHRNSDNHMFTPLIEEFAQKVQEQTNGEIIIEVFGNNELGDVDEILEQIQMGSVDINLGGVGNLGKFSSKYNSIVLPFLFESYDHAYATVTNDFLPWVQDEMEGLGFHMLNSVWAAGFRQLTSNSPVNTPEDVAGMKVRVPATKANNEFVQALGGVTETVAFGELYNALKQGLVDAQENPIATIYANQYYDCQKYIAITNHLYDFDVMVFNTDTWNSLTAEQQTVIENLASEYGKQASAMMESYDEETLAELESAGMTVARVDSAAFQAKMDSAYENLSADYSAENVQAMLEMAAKNK